MRLPEIVANYIDNEILPIHADRHNSDERIYSIILDESTNFIDELESDLESEEKILINCYCAIGRNEQTIIDYIEQVRM